MNNEIIVVDTLNYIGDWPKEWYDKCLAEWYAEWEDAEWEGSKWEMSELEWKRSWKREHQVAFKGADGDEHQQQGIPHSEDSCCHYYCARHPEPALLERPVEEVTKIMNNRKALAVSHYHRAKQIRQEVEAERIKYGLPKPVGRFDD